MSGVRILIAEDNIATQKLARLQVEKLGYQAHVVGNGAEALAALSRAQYHAVLMDVSMPEMDGFEATATIRAWEARDKNRGHLAIIAMTANTLLGERERCLDRGMDDYISKPVTLETMRDVLRRWVPSTEALETLEI